MEKVINAENIRSYAYVNENVLTLPVRGIVLSFFGLGSTAMYRTETQDGELYGEKGILYIVPYTQPWAWGNDNEVAYADEIVDVMKAKYGCESAPVVSTGGSMGGLVSLIYSLRSRHRPVACVADCPVCDAKYHYNERADLPRTFYNALYGAAGTLDEALGHVSPYHQAEKMPDITYKIVHCDADTMVNIDAHSVRFVEKMKSLGRDITLDVVHGRDHGDLDLGARRKIHEYVFAAVDGHAKK